MEQLGALADEMTPVFTDLGAVAPDINRFLLELGPFSQAAIPAFDTLGDAAVVGTPAIRTATPVLQDTQKFAAKTKPVAKLLKNVLTSFQAQRRAGAAARLRLLLGDRGQRLRLVRPLPARGADRQPVLDVRGRAHDGLLGQLPPRDVEQRERGRRPGSRATRCSTGPRACSRASTRATRRRPSRSRRPGPPRKRVKQGTAAAAAPADGGLGASEPASEPLLDYLFGGDER